MKRRLICCDITNQSFEEIVDAILAKAAARVSGYVCLANVHMVIEAYCHPEFRDVVNRADIATPDGKPLAIFMNLLYGTSQTRVAGYELMLDLFRHAEQRGLSVYFYGSTPDVLERLCEKLSREYPALKIAGIKSPPFRTLSTLEEEADVAEIKHSGANLIFVGLGCPKQERFMNRFSGKTDGVMLGVGAAFPFYTGQLKRAPAWMRENSLEWLYRLYIEPKRLFKRYFYTNIMFLILISLQFIRHKFVKTIWK